MKRQFTVLALLLSTMSIAFAQQAPQQTRSAAMHLMSSAFPDGTVIPIKYSQAAPGGAVSPGFTWDVIPPGTQSYVLWMHDIDLAFDKTTEDNLHWLVWNIPGQSTSLPENLPAGATLADGTHQKSYFNDAYRGPGAAASGPLHHYIFELYALDTKIDEKPAATPLETRTNIFKLMQGHILGKAAYFGLFKRPQ